ncbi:TetR/AcrR family transcriptional regulator [Rathayibacter sp. ZW T2_19]|uniref:TetR/AcrR family transcriptional regulator n=1 Tax=Rathayibacter rubneri TaxID=2950106 RepID=A0A9X2IW49_9MICO|nr:TetR/AcrR family transcriptional regulator [Rathayibacter rubneri]MCM6764264.1 TetR/AcrR family transcriptional regulator [Rathayibacter rubneri]
MTTSRAPRRDATDNRAAILLAARTLLRTDPDASLEAIAAEAGVTRRTVYGHFSSREQLLTTVFQEGAARIAAALSPVRHEDPACELALIGSRMWHEVEAIRLPARAALRSPYAEIVAGTLEPVRAQLRATASRGISSGRFRPDLDAARLARLVEDAAIAVLDEAADSELGEAQAERLVMVDVLAIAGFGWADADALAARVLAEGAGA